MGSVPYVSKCNIILVCLGSFGIGNIRALDHITLTIKIKLVNNY